MLPTFDPHFTIFHELMMFKVRDILLVSSLYDAFIMEEDGSIAMRLINEYQGLNLSNAPRITRVSSASEAIETLHSRYFDMVITMPYLGGMHAQELAAEIKKIQPHIPVILVAHTYQDTLVLPGEVNRIDRSFLWCCESDFLLALIKNVEDHRNADADTERAMVRVIIYVEDNSQYRSFFLPLIYHEVVIQTQAVLDESLNERHRILRMRARPKILMATNYEEAIALYQRYKPYVFAVISDARIPRQGKLDGGAGVHFIKQVRKDIPDLPMLLLSSESSNRDLAQKIPAVFIDKDSSTIKEEIHQFCLNHLGFGNFIFRMIDQSPVAEASSLREFEEQIGNIPDESLLYHLSRNHFSNWVMARSEVALAKDLHCDIIGPELSADQVRDRIIEKIRHLRKSRQSGVVVRFASSLYDPEINDFVKMGNGSLGGKARGLAFMWAMLQMNPSELIRQHVVIPKTCVITSQGFDDFIALNKLHGFQAESDEHIGDIFIECVLPQWLRDELYHFLSRCDFPLSVRSSSLLEDAHFRPYAGLYSTYFLTNNQDEFSERLAQLESAIKLVFASTWFEGPRAFAKTTNHGRGEEAMAIIIQELSGKRYGDHFYPAVSGVVQSHNYYPVLKMTPEEGIAHIALGLGKTVVEGEKALRFSPAQPKRLIQFSAVSDVLANSQRQFYCLDMRNNNCLNRYRSNLVRREVQDAEHELPVQILSSTYLADEDRVRDVNVPGLKIMSFAPLLKYNMFPLPAILTEIMQLGRDGMGCEIEIEFTLNMAENIEDSKVNILQIRPMVTGGERREIHICSEEIEKAFGYSAHTLGHGTFNFMRDILFVDMRDFDVTTTRKIAAEIACVNRGFMDRNEKYLIIGPGRWGSADRWLGIPVMWNDISHVGAIVEICHSELKAEPSQGSHFFQNITSLGIPYITIAHEAEENASGVVDNAGERTDFFDWDWLYRQEMVWQGDFVCHVRLPNNFMLKCNGATSKSVMLYSAEEESLFGCATENETHNEQEKESSVGENNQSD